jgi:hypothetical protein
LMEQIHKTPQYFTQEDVIKIQSNAHFFQ